MPKRPQTPYIRFFMSKRPAYAAKHPKMSLMDVTKALAAKFKLLPENKKVSGMLRVFRVHVQGPGSFFLEKILKDFAVQFSRIFNNISMFMIFINYHCEASGSIY